MAIVNFNYSIPFESSLLKLTNKSLTREHSKTVLEKVKLVQNVWNKYELKILSLFELIYKIKVEEKSIKAYVSLVLLNSFSDPLTISLKRFSLIETSDRSKRGFVYETIHELAHYFAYSRPRDSYFNELFSRILKIDLLKSEGANLHYLIQAVEFGIISEVFGKEYAEYSQNWTIEKLKDTEYGISAQRLKSDGVPLDKTCLEFIDRNILS